MMTFVGGLITRLTSYAVSFDILPSLFARLLSIYVMVGNVSIPASSFCGTSRIVSIPAD